MNVRDELVASMARRGMEPPAKPYAPSREPYRRPGPLDPDAPKRVRLTNADRAAIREMRDAGVSWSEIGEQYPDQTPKHLRAVARARRAAECVRCGRRVDTEKAPGATVACAKCLPEMDLRCVDCGKPVKAGRERCPRCQRARKGMAA